MCRQMKASFNLPVGTITVIADIMSRRIHEPHRLTIIDGAVPDNAHVIGDAQYVMFFIGEVASHGYDDLIAVGAA